MKAIATVAGIGFSPVAPGTVGSVAAIPLAWGLHWLGSFPMLLAATVIAGIAGVWATERYITQSGTSHDPSEVVIDEVVGQWIALWPLSWGLWTAGSPAHVFPWPGWVAAFVFFRLFDIWKPGPVGWADRRGDALGVMLDDVIAGVLAAIVVTVLAGVAHGWI